MYYAFDRRWLRSPVTVTLVMINIALFAGNFLTKGFFYRAGVLNIERLLEHQEVNRLVSSMFLHSDLWHLFSNMLLLFYLGAVVERNLGPLSFTILYLASGIAGNVLTVWVETARNETWQSLGASGAVFGVMGAMLILLIRLPKERRSGSSLLPRVAFMVGYSLLMGLKSGTVNNIAHIGGLITGALLGFLFALPLKDIDLRALL